MNDLHVTIDAFIGMVIAEAIAKPIAIRVGRFILSRLDNKIKIIPDWIYNPGESDEG